MRSLYLTIGDNNAPFLEPLDTNTDGIRYSDIYSNFISVLVLTGVVSCVEDTELSTLITSLWNSDTNAATSHDLRYSYQQHTDTSSSTDHAPNRSMIFFYLHCI